MNPTQLEEEYKNWFGVATTPQPFARLILNADALFRSLYPNIPPFESMSEECRTNYKYALFEQVYYFENNKQYFETKQTVKSIALGDASESYSAPDVETVSKISDNSCNWLDKCNFRYVGIARCIDDGSCGC